MIRNKQPQTNEVVADMSEYSIDGGRLTAQQRLEKILLEREILIKRKKELEGLICKAKLKRPNGILNAGEQKARLEIVDEIQQIHKRLAEIKPTKIKLTNELQPQQGVILEEILLVLKDIKMILRNKQ